jgi:POT family proton-dependent oligopeptide transporter
VEAAKSVPPILMVFALIPIFFSLFDQTNTTWVLQGEKMTSVSLLGFQIGAEEMQSMNALMVMILVPLFTLVIYPHIGRVAAPLNRMTIGMFLAAGSYVVVAALQTRIDNGMRLSVLWQTVPYFILTAAEVLVSTTGLEFAFREAAPEMKSIVMSFWLLTIAFGDLFVAVLTKLLSNGTGDAAVSPGRFMQYAGLTFVVAILFTIVTRFYRYRDAAAARGK